MGITRRAYTIIEVVIVLMIIGIALAMAAPGFARVTAAPSNSPQQVIGSARHTAIERAQTLTLVIAPDGSWNLAEAAAPGRELAHGAIDPVPMKVGLTISPAGICVPSERGRLDGSTVDPVSCAVHSVAASR
ncbi:MAG: type II secretion system GspH family protein [Gemmatimonadota bacterium]|nr:type II secretion system GspH family protein [Gemmatimonadota bacterium]